MDNLEILAQRIQSLLLTHNSLNLQSTSYQCILMCLLYNFNFHIQVPYHSNLQQITQFLIKKSSPYFHQQSDTVLQACQRVFNFFKQTKEVQQQEGFFTCDDSDIEIENENQQKMPVITNLVDHQQGNKNQQQNPVESVQERDHLLELTIGYMRDLQNYREQLFRKNDLNLDVFEVKYFDVTEIVDERYRELLNLKIQDIKHQYERIVQSYIIKQKIQDKEYEKFMKQMQDHEQKLKQLSTPMAIATKLIQMVGDPYKIWKIIQDIKGGTFFLPVFFNPNKVIGIDYNVINAIMTTDEAFKREFDSYKKTIDTEVEQLVKGLKQSIDDYHQQIQELDASKENYNVMLQQEKEQIKREMIQKLEIMQNLCNQKDLQKQKELEKQVYNYKIRYMIQIWALASQDNKNSYASKLQIKKVLTNSLLIDEMKSNHIIEMDALLNELEDLKRYSKQLIIDNYQNSAKNQALEQKYDKLLYDFNQLKSQLKTNSDKQKQSINKCKVIEKTANILIELVDKSIDLTDFKQENKLSSVSKFTKRIEDLVYQDKKLINEVMEQNEKNNCVQATIEQMVFMQTKETLTDIFNITNKFDQTQIIIQEKIVIQPQIIQTQSQSQPQQSPVISNLNMQQGDNSRGKKSNLIVKKEKKQQQRSKEQKEKSENKQLDKKENKKEKEKENKKTEILFECDSENSDLRNVSCQITGRLESNIQKKNQEGQLERTKAHLQSIRSQNVELKQTIANLMQKFNEKEKESKLIKEKEREREQEETISLRNLDDFNMTQQMSQKSQPQKQPSNHSINSYVQPTPQLLSNNQTIDSKLKSQNMQLPLIIGQSAYQSLTNFTQKNSVAVQANLTCNCQVIMSPSQQSQKPNTTSLQNTLMNFPPVTNTKYNNNNFQSTRPNFFYGRQVSYHNETNARQNEFTSLDAKKQLYLESVQESFRKKAVTRKVKMSSVRDEHLNNLLHKFRDEDGMILVPDGMKNKILML